MPTRVRPRATGTLSWRDGALILVTIVLLSLALLVQAAPHHAQTALESLVFLGDARADAIDDTD